MDRGRRAKWKRGRSPNTELIAASRFPINGTPYVHQQRAGPYGDATWPRGTRSWRVTSSYRPSYGADSSSWPATSLPHSLFVDIAPHLVGSTVTGDVSIDVVRDFEAHLVAVRIRDRRKVEVLHLLADRSADSHRPRAVELLTCRVCALGREREQQESRIC